MAQEVGELSAGQKRNQGIRRNYEGLLSWLSKQSDEFLLQVHKTGLTEIAGTSNVMIIDEQTAGSPKIFVKPVHEIEAMQQHVIGPVPTIIRTAKEKRRGNFPAIVVQTTILLKGHAHMFSPCNLPFVTAQGLQAYKNFTRPTILPHQNLGTMFPNSDPTAILDLIAAISKLPTIKTSSSSGGTAKATNPAATNDAKANVVANAAATNDAKTNIAANAAATNDANANIVADAAEEPLVTAANVRLLWKRTFENWIDLQDLSYPS